MCFGAAQHLNATAIARDHILSEEPMPRPTVLVAEPEPLQSLSVRKLVLETAKFNVLTAHSTREALELFELFPNINAAVLVNDESMKCDEIAMRIKGVTDKVPIIGLRCENVDHQIPSYEPEELLALLRRLLGDPRKLETTTKR